MTRKRLERIEQKQIHEMAVDFMKLSANDRNMIRNLISRLLEK